MNAVPRRIVVSAAALAAAIVGVAALMGDSAAETSPASDGGRGQAELVMVRCNSTSPDFTVVAFRGSSGAPSKKGETCPEVLSQLMRDGFVVADVGHYDVDGDYVLYLLSRR